MEVRVTRGTAGLAAGLLMCASTAFTEISSGEAKRLHEASTVVRELRTAENGVSEDVWNRAECIAVIPGLKKAAFVVGGEFGKGLISCRSGRTWGAPLFLEMEKGSAGFQIGAEQIDLILLVMNRHGIDKMLDNKINLGVDGSVAAGPLGRAAAASTDGRLNAEILAYSRAKGLFAGVDVSGGALRLDKRANTNAYGADVKTREVLFGNGAAPPPAAQAFMRTLREESRATSGKKD